MAKTNTPYEILNAAEWTTGDFRDLNDDTADEISDEDEWAEGHSTAGSHKSANSDASKISRHSAQQSALQSHQILPDQYVAAQVDLQPRADPHRKLYADTDGVGWSTVKNRSEVKKEAHSGGAQNDSQTLPRQQSGLQGDSVRVPHIGQANTITAPHATTTTFRPRVPRKLPAKAYHFARDNEAKAAYRRRLPETQRYELFKNAEDIEPNQAKMCRMLAELGVRYKTFLCPPRAGQERIIKIWGRPVDVRRTLRYLEEWIRNITEGPSEAKTNHKSKFAHVQSTLTDRYRKEQEQVKKEARLRSFQQTPEPGKTFPFQGWILWDVDEIGPYEVFGISLEAFDSIRSRCKCHIVFEETIRALKILSNTKNHIDVAIERLEIAIKGLKAKSVRNIAKYLVEFPPISDIHQEVTLLERPADSMGATKFLTARLSGEPVNAQTRVKYLKIIQESHAKNVMYVEQSLLRILPSLPHYLGQLRLQILFGTFRLTKFRLRDDNRTFPVEAFLEEMRNPGIKGEIVRDMHCCKTPDAIMSSVFSARNLFEPIGPLKEALNSVAPIISARFIIERMDRPSVQYQVEFTKSLGDDNMYEVIQGGWSREDRKGNRSPLIINMTQMDGTTSWQLAITNEHNLDVSFIDPKMMTFEESVKLQPNDIENTHLTGRKQVTFSTALPGPSMFEQKTACRFRLIPDPRWVVEIARYDTYRPRSDLPAATNWAASMSNSDWDSLVSQNTSLKIGECANWEPTLENFLPVNECFGKAKADSGVEDLLQSVRLVKDFLDELKGE